MIAALGGTTSSQLTMQNVISATVQIPPQQMRRNNLFLPLELDKGVAESNLLNILRMLQLREVEALKPEVKLILLEK